MTSKHLMYGVAVLGLLTAGAVQAQEATVSTGPSQASPQATPQAPAKAATKTTARADDTQTVVVVGSRIRGAKTTAALPVTVLSSSQIAATGAVTGDDLLRTIPEMGNVSFNASNGQQTNNSARGDVASIDLRGAGIGDTLVLVDGRRMVSYPTSQSKGNVPLITYNAQALPLVGMDRLEVLREGAGAIYGSDAVAGVVNVVTKNNFNGFQVDGQMGQAEGTHRREYDENIFMGKDFDHGRGNVSLMIDLGQRTAQLPGDEPFTANQDLRAYFANDAGYNTSTVPDGRGNQGSWPAITVVGATSAIKQGKTSITTAAGAFHIQPDTLGGCVTEVSNGLCIGTGAVPYSTTANVLKYNAVANNAITIAPAVSRANFSFNAHYDLTDDVTLYTSDQYYSSESHGLTTQPTTLVAVGVPASNYWNPLGPVTFANGTTNPNRLPGLTNVPASGLPVTIATYRFDDLGPDHVDVASYQDRFLVGLKGHKYGWDWDSAILYGEAQVTDTSDGVDSNKLAASLALSTPDAYDPFNGSCLNGAGGGDCTPSSQAALNSIKIRLVRRSITTLLNGDFKVTRSDLFALPGGEVGIAMGVEARREGHEDIRDPRVNGSEPFTDPVTGLVSLSSATGVNVTPSTSGHRTVFSAYTELAVPIISPEMNIPLVKSVDFQLAGRYEHYSDFGDVAKPKVAMAWDVVDGVRLRASWEQGFKAPNLETTNPFTYARAQTVTDYLRCAADLKTGKIANFTACNHSVGVTYFESGNPELKPETSESYDVGAVFQPTFIPDTWGRYTLTIDRWQLKQVGIVGVIGPTNLAIEDYLSRVNGGAGNPNVIRAAPTADDIAEFAGSGLTPVGAITQINDKFENLQPQIIQGTDFGLAWHKRTDHIGTFDANIDATFNDKFFQPPSPEVQSLFAARASGQINAATPLTDPGNQLEVLGNPKWKSLTSLTWTYKAWQIGSSVQYTGETKDTNFLSVTGIPWTVKSYTQVNLDVQYTAQSGMLKNVRLKLGVRDLFNRLPPIESDGYNGALYDPYGRYWYFNIGKSF